MHRKQSTDLIPADTELEKTLRSLRKIKKAENSIMADERQEQTDEHREAVRRPPITYTMEDFWRPIIQDEYSAIRQPAVEANNFELKPALITMVQQHQFTGHPTEDPNEHLGRFLRMANTVKLNGVRPEVIKLHLFPFSLRDTAATWYESLPYGSVDTWEELVEAYLCRFFPPSLTSERRREIIVFQQGEDESLYVAWERFKRLLKRCPMHGIDLKTQMDIVYHALNDISKGIIDASCCGAFKRKSAEEARDLIEDLAKCNMKTPSEFSRGTSRGKGILELNKMSAMEAKLDAIMHRMDKQEKKTYTAHEIGAVERELLKEGADRTVEEQFYNTEEAKYLGEQRNYHFKPNTNLPTHYHPALRNHENLSYGGGASQGPRQVQNPPQGYQQPPRFQQQQQQGIEHRNEYHGQRRALSFEEQMLQFMGDNKKLLNLHEQKFAELGAAATNFQVFQNTTNATLKNLETQVGQLALTLQSQKKDAFPSDTKKNPKDCMAVQLRSGKELEMMTEKVDSNIEREGPEREKELERKKERVDRKDLHDSVPAVPFPQRLQKSKIEEQFARFLRTFQKLEISMPFTEVVTQMPLYAKFLKDILSKKRKIEREGIVNLTATCSALMKKELPEKMKDPGSFTIPCMIEGVEIQKALCDSGASINLMPLSVAKQLSLGELIPTTITLQMADRSMVKPEGVLEDVLVTVGKFVFPVDFIVLEMEAYSQVPLLLGRPFLATGAALRQRKEKIFRIIYYASRTFNEAQENYSTTEKEMLAIVFACEKFRQYILGSHVVVHTDHAAIKYLMSKKEAKPRLIRWVLLLQEFDLEIKDKRGCDNVIADHLSRAERSTGEEEEVELKENFPDEQLFTVSCQLPWYADIVNYLACGVVPSEFTSQQKRKLRTDSRYYIWDDPFLFKRGADMIIRKCVPETEQGKILDECHASPYGGAFLGRKNSSQDTPIWILLAHYFQRLCRMG